MYQKEQKENLVSIIKPPEKAPKKKRKTKSKMRKEMEVFLRWSGYIIGIIAPLFVIPQIILVWQGNTQGISIITWSFMLIKSSIFAAWGVEKRVGMLMFKEGMQTLMVSLVLLGLLI